MIKQYVLFSLVLFACFLASGCSDSASKNNDSKGNYVVGSAVKGIISNGTVKAYANREDKQLLAVANTNPFGRFILSLPDDAQTDDIVLLELTVNEQTRMRCDLTSGCFDSSAGQIVSFGDDIHLPENFKLLGIAFNNSVSLVNAYISPLSHLIISTAKKNNQTITKDSIKIASNWVSNAFDLSQSPIETLPIDITQLLNQTTLTDEQLKQSILSAAMYTETLSAEWSLGNESIDSLDLKDILSRAADLAGDLSARLQKSNPNQAATLNRIQSDTEAQLVSLNTSEIIILTQPGSVLTTENESFSLYIQANSDLNLNYQWFKNGNPIPSSNSSIYSVSNSNLNDAGLYHVIVSNGISELSSLSASVTVNKAEQALQITQQPQGQSITEGESISLSVNASGDGAIQYQWQKNGSLIPGATASTYFVANSQVQDAGSYRVMISNDSQQISSNFVNVWVSEAVKPVSITKQPQSQVIPTGNNVVFNVSATGGGFLGYQWRKNGVAINNAFNTSFSISSVTQSDSGNYDVIISNSQGSVISAAANLSVIANSVPVSITNQPQSQTVITGTPFTLSISATGDDPITYQWFLEGNAISNANSNLYTITSANAGHEGNYSVLVSNSESSELSDNALITVDPVPFSSIVLSWETPRTREDGSPLGLDEIQGYVIEYGTSLTSLQNIINVSNQLPNTTTIDNILPGTVYLRIATIDSDSRQGEFSDIISVTIP